MHMILFETKMLWKIQVITCGILSVFFFVGGVSEKKGPEWLLTYDSQQYDRYLFFKIFFACLHFLFHLKRNTRFLRVQPKTLPNIISQPSTKAKCRYILWIHPKQWAFIFSRNYEMQKPIVKKWWFLVFSHPKINNPCTWDMLPLYICSDQ